MAARRKTKNITASQLHLQGEFGTLVSVHDVYHENVDRIFPENTVNDSQIGCSSNGGQQEDKSIQNSVTKVSFCTITFESVHNGDHNGTLRSTIF